MDKIIDFEPAEKEKAETASLSDELLSAADFGAFLMLEDEKFNTLAPLVLEQLEKGLQNSNIRRSLYVSFIANGGNLNDIHEFYSNFTEEAEKQLGENFSDTKKDFLKAMIALMINGIEDAAAESERLIAIPIEVLDENVKIPTYAHDTDAGMDVYALDDYTIAPGETKLIPTGFKVAIPTGYELQVRPRSGMSLKTKLRIANAPGTIDSGYRGEVGVIVENVASPIQDITYDFDEAGRPIITSIAHGPSYTIGKGEKFAQLVLSAVPKVSFEKVTKVPEAGDRNGGFGSTGKK